MDSASPTSRLDYRLWLGQVAGVWFFGCLFIFAAAYPGYSHLTKAVSELGAFGAPHAGLWNLLGFGLTGLLIVLFGSGLQHLLARRGVSSSGGWEVVAIGASFAATAIPADMELRLKSPWTVAHAAFSLLGPVLLIWAAVVWPRALTRLGATRFSRIACILAGWSIVAAFLSNALLEKTPGVGQRLGMLALFFWCLMLSRAVTQINSVPARDS